MSELKKLEPYLPGTLFRLDGKDVTDESLTFYKLRLNKTILLDEMCVHLKDYLSSFGYKVKTVKEVLTILPNNKSVIDEQILNYAIKKNVFLVTRDRELKNICDENKIPYLFSSHLILGIIEKYLKNMKKNKMSELKTLKDPL